MPPSILVVDDDPEGYALLTDHLEAQGYATIAARTGEEALVEPVRYQETSRFVP